MTGGKRILAGLAGGVAFVALLLFTLAPSSSGPRPQTLPDGTILSIGQVSFGKVHRYVEGNFLQKFAGRVLPEKYSRKLGIRLVCYTNATDTTVIFLRAYKPHGAFAQSVGASINYQDDDNNCGNFQGVLVSRFSSNLLVEVSKTPLPPRLSQNLRLSFVHEIDSKSNHTASTVFFTVRNPAPHAPGTWVAPPLPQTNSVGDLQVELVNLQRIPLQAPTNYTGPLTPSYAETAARLRILQNGVPTEAWKVSGLEVFDEAGNSNDLSRDEWSVAFQGAFSPNEVYKFRFELSRNAPYEPWEMTTASNVLAFKTNATPREREVRLKLNGYLLTLFPSPASGPSAAGLYKYLITPNPKGLGGHLILTSTSPSGQRAILREQDTRRSLSGLFGVLLPIDAVSNREDLTFILTTNRYVDFMVRPGTAQSRESGLR